MRSVTDACRVIALLLIVVLSACNSGSGGGNGQSSTSVTSNNITFSVLSPDSLTPAAQTFTATVSPGTVYVAILSNGRAIASTSYTLSGTTAQIVVNPPSPSSLGVGVFTGTITVTGYTCGNPTCSVLTAGNSQIVNVSYPIPPIVRFVAPYVGVDNKAGVVVIRGQGFLQFAVQNVMFGTVPATAFTVMSDTEIQASYQLAASITPYPVQVQMPSSPGPIISLANLVIVSPATCGSPTTLAYPPPITAPTVNELVYDAERQALLVADSTDGKILRYSCSGGSWTTAAIPLLSDIALSTDGGVLLALSQTALTRTDPATLTTLLSPPSPTFAPSTVFKNLAVGNDGNAVITTGNPPGTSALLYLYCNPVYVTICQSPFIQPATPALDNSTAVASADGSLIVLMQGDPTLTSALSVYVYAAASDTFGATAVALNQNTVAPTLSVSTPPNTTTSTTRIVLNGTNVYDASYNLLGTLPSTTLAVVIKPNAATGAYTAYTFDSNMGGQVLSFDLTNSQAGLPYPPVATITPANPGTGVRMAISPDGGTLFLAGNSQIVIIPSF